MLNASVLKFSDTLGAGLVVVLGVIDDTPVGNFCHGFTPKVVGF
tara:strand:- start:276 stop:407 length:132 start_codon:yes stop_codon:yes gene_type:complete